MGKDTSPKPDVNNKVVLNIKRKFACTQLQTGVFASKMEYVESEEGAMMRMDKNGEEGHSEEFENGYEGD